MSRNETIHEQNLFAADQRELGNHNNTHEENIVNIAVIAGNNITLNELPLTCK